MTNYSRIGNRPGKPAYRTPSRFARETVSVTKSFALRQKYPPVFEHNLVLKRGSKRITGSGLFGLVYETVKNIPRGKVATYGQIARIIKTRDSRKVGWALHGKRDPKVPCQRVVNKNGEVALNYGFVGGWKEQKRRLLTEGVTFITRTRVDLKKHLWYP